MGGEILISHLFCCPVVLQNNFLLNAFFEVTNVLPSKVAGTALSSVQDEFDFLCIIASIRSWWSICWRSRFLPFATVFRTLLLNVTITSSPFECFEEVKILLSIYMTLCMWVWSLIMRHLAPYCIIFEQTVYS